MQNDDNNNPFNRLWNAGSNFSLRTLLKSSPLSSRVQSHLVRVYSALAATFGASAIGAYLQLNQFISIGSGFSGLLSLVCMLGVLFSRPTRENQNYRLAGLLGMGAFQGMSLAPLLSLSLTNFANGASLIMQALGVSALTFTGFSASALLNTRRSYLYMGVNGLFFQSQAFFGAELFIGLLMFCGFILYDTQLIVERAERGSDDFIGHSVDLFVDGISLFVRLLIILMRREDEREDRRRKRRD
ncbi:hypothetical protein ROZALSC1DRAFT_21170 [Rozella allomycis CSF55]|uniref:Bax inhibitor 1 n=1 Tax=Rozella allomycis (strain CSF55) TaxID=988480 RepID=A0A4P9YM00_ROZAC|nr:hypothetical protein ROZALSC1DRAFT_21170 [Rozella allomycis CSF55]